MLQIKSFNKFLLASISILLSSTLSAETYIYTGSLFTQATLPYTTSMNVSLTIQTNTVIPANSNLFDITNIISSWSISDGVQTITDTTGSINPNAPPLFSTDATGNITSYSFLVVSEPHTSLVGGLDNYIGVFSIAGTGADETAMNIDCLNVINAFCAGWGGVSGVTPMASNSNDFGDWREIVVPNPTSVPSLSTWGLLLLILSLLFVTNTHKRKA